jgi:hypothetical protein
VQLINNVFLGGGDDGIDLDAVDALREGNVFMNFHRIGSPDSTSNGVATGSASGMSNLTDAILRRNIFFNNDHHVLLKEGAFLTSEHNVYYGATIGAFQLSEVDTTAGGGAVFGRYLEVNGLIVNDRPVTKSINQSIVPAAGRTWHPTLNVDPQFVNIAGQDFHLKPRDRHCPTARWARIDATHSGSSSMNCWRATCAITSGHVSMLWNCTISTATVDWAACGLRTTRPGRTSSLAPGT